MFVWWVAGPKKELFWGVIALMPVTGDVESSQLEDQMSLNLDNKFILGIST